MKKLHYVYKSTSGCFGADSHGQRLSETFTNKKLAIKYMHIQNIDKRTVYWVDFEWRA